MEPKKESLWICECGKETVQPEGPNTKIVTHCECGKQLMKIKDPEGGITYHKLAQDWFIKEYDEQNKKMVDYEMTFNKSSFLYFKFLKDTLESIEKLELGKGAMKRIQEGGAKRHKLDTKTMQWKFNRYLKRWMGREYDRKK